MKKIIAFILFIVFLFSLLFLDLLFYKLGVQKKVLDTIFTYLPTKPYYLEEMQVNTISSSRKYEICPKDSPAQRRDTNKYSELKFVEKNFNDDVDNLTPPWLQSVLKIKKFDIHSVFENNKALYYFHGDFNNDHKVDALVFKKSKFIKNGKQNIALLINNEGKLKEDKSFRHLDLLCGDHEQVLIADFDNDSDLDIFLSCSTDMNVKYELHTMGYYDKKPQSFFLINDGKGKFSERAFEAGIAIHNTSVYMRPEGASVADFNEDGWLDIIVSSRLFINNRDNTFTDQREEYGLPMQFDEGLSVADVNNDGTLDVIYHQPTAGPLIYTQKNNKFEYAHCLVQPSPHNDSGMSLFDINMDGWVDIMNSWRPLENTRSFSLLGSSKGFFAERAEWWEFPIKKNASPVEKIKVALEAPSYFLIDSDSRIDLIANLDQGGQKIFINETDISPLVIHIEMVDSDGMQNQQGRKITLIPQDQQSIIYTKLVDAGSGYLTQSQYPVVFYSQFNKKHHGKAFFSDKVVSFQTEPGDKLRIYKSGKVEKINY